MLCKWPHAVGYLILPAVNPSHVTWPSFVCLSQPVSPLFFSFSLGLPHLLTTDVFFLFHSCFCLSPLFAHLVRHATGCISVQSVDLLVPTNDKTEESTTADHRLSLQVSFKLHNYPSPPWCWRIMIRVQVRFAHCTFFADIFAMNGGLDELCHLICIFLEDVTETFDFRSIHV